MWRAAAWLTVVAVPAEAQASEQPLTVERQTQIIAEAAEICYVPHEERALHAQRNRYSHQENALLESACRLVESLMAELAAYRALDDLDD